MNRQRRRRTIALLAATLVGLGCWATSIAPAQASTTKQLTVQFWHLRVVLTVPTSWHVSQTAPTPQCGCGGDYNPVCIVDDGDYGLNPNNCVLVIGGNTSEQLPDEPVPGWRLPACDDWTTTYAANSQVGNRAGQYRIFLDRCHDLKSEQWTSFTTPSVAIWHPLHWSWDDTVAANVVDSARISGRGLTEDRTSDLGYVRNMFRRDGRVYVTIDRGVRSLTGHVINHYPTTYNYRLRPRKDYGGCPRFLSICTPEQLLAQFHKGTDPADGSRAVAGRLIALRRDTGWSVAEPYLWAFESRGDPGHCGC